MLAGEYAVVDGGPALVMAVDRVATATLAIEPQNLSPFLLSAQTIIAEKYGQDSQQAYRASRVVVCTESFRHEGTKIGLGSSAAATVAAIGMSIAQPGEELDQSLVHQLAAKAHALAQAKMGARGSGADIACASYGGLRLFQAQGKDRVTTRTCHLPADLQLVFPWTQKAASTAPMVRAVQEFKGMSPKAYRELRTEISSQAMALAGARDASDAITAIKMAGDAVRRLGEAAEVTIWSDAHSHLASIAARFGGVVKPTGAGGGDLAMAAFDNPVSAESFTGAVTEEGIFCPHVSVDNHGVRMLPADNPSIGRNSSALSPRNK